MLTERIGARDDAYPGSTDSAFCALTDFRRQNPISAEAEASIDDAYADMNRMGVHALLVTQQKLGRVDSQVIGLITAYDIERQRPHRSPRASGFVVRQHFRVGDVMTPWNELKLVEYESLGALTAVDASEGQGS
jgi:CBS domain-containing protein